MPLLLCPNDNGPMQTVQRSGVEFDICPTCRGVWLDRGELEKMLAAAHQEMSRSQPDGVSVPQQSSFLTPPHVRQNERRDWDERDDDHHPKRRRSSIFDIFD